MNKHILIVTLLMISSRLSAEGYDNFFRVYNGDTRTNQCQKRYNDLLNLRTEMRTAKASDDTSLSKLEAELDQYKANLAILNGLKAINRNLMRVMRDLTPEGIFFTNDARKVERIQNETQNAVADYTRFKTMKHLLEGIQHTMDQEQLSVDGVAGLDNEEVRVSWLYNKLKENHRKYSSMGPIGRDYFSDGGDPSSDINKMELIKGFVRSYAKTIFNSDGTLISQERRREQMLRYQNELFDSVPSDAQRFAAELQVERVNTVGPYQEYRSCLTSDAVVSPNKAAVCESKKTAWIASVNRVKSEFQALKNELQLSPRNIDKYANLSVENLEGSVTAMEASLNPVAQAKQDLITRLQNMQKFREARKATTSTQGQVGDEEKRNFYNNSIRNLLCNTTTNQTCTVPQDLINPDLTFNIDAMRNWLASVNRGDISDEKIEQQKRVEEQKIRELEGKIAEITNTPESKSRSMAMGILTDYLIKNCQNDSAVPGLAVVTCQDSNLGEIRALTSTISGLAQNVRESVIELRGGANASIVELNTECRKIQDLASKSQSLRDMCQMAAAEYVAIVQRNKNLRDNQDFLNRHAITPNENGEIYCTNNKGDTEICADAIVTPSEAGYGRAIGEAFTQHFMGDNIVPGWMQVGINHFTLDDQLALQYQYGIQEKTYLSWQQQYWQNIQNQCMFAVGMCVPVTAMSSSNPMFNFTP